MNKILIALITSLSLTGFINVWAMEHQEDKLKEQLVALNKARIECLETQINLAQQKATTEKEKASARQAASSKIAKDNDFKKNYEALKKAWLREDAVWEQEANKLLLQMNDKITEIEEQRNKIRKRLEQVREQQREQKAQQWKREADERVKKESQEKEAQKNQRQLNEERELQEKKAQEKKQVPQEAVQPALAPQQEERVGDFQADADEQIQPPSPYHALLKHKYALLASATPAVMAAFIAYSARQTAEHYAHRHPPAKNSFDARLIALDTWLKTHTLETVAGVAACCFLGAIIGDLADDGSLIRARVEI